MSITDELRKWASVEVPYKYGHQLCAVADRIDAEHQKAIRELNNLADASVLLPVDADGVPIRVGDVMESKDCRLLFGETSFEVRSMRCDECGWEVYDRLGDRYAPSLLRHHHEPTVEDVLREFFEEVGDGLHTLKAVDTQVIIAKYAKMLRLTGGDE